LFQSTYYIDKSSNTFADNLAAFGLAFVLNGIAVGRSRITLEDQGSVFAIRCEPALHLEWVEHCVFFSGAPFLITFDKKAGRKAVKGTNVTPQDFSGASDDVMVDYEVQKQNNQQYFEWRKELSAENRKLAADRKLSGPATPHPDWDIFRAINPMALQGYNALLAEWWRGQEAFPELLKVLLHMTMQTPNDLAGAEIAWNTVCKAHGWNKPKDATALQLLNPAQGKGGNSPKAEWREPNNVKGFWLLEWLKAVGLFQAGITRIIANPSDPRNAKDRKTYALVPVRVEWGMHQTVMSDFRQAMMRKETAIKLDIFAALRYTQVFLKHYEEARIEDFEVELLGRRPADLVGGMQMAFYKNLGNSSAVMNMALINLPGWVRLRRRDDLARLRTALDEHLAIVRNLDETRGDQFNLLTSYRDFLSANDLTPFFEFTTAYSGFILTQYERRKYVRPFTTTTLEVILMNNDDPKQTFSMIVQNEGFQNVAYAIRHSTVVPQGRKAKGNKPVVDVRYGLGQQLARKSAYPVDFLAEIAEFLHLYNAENAQLRENKREPFRKNITTADIEALTSLVDQFGSKVVCNMLVAYGYAREPYEAKDEEPASEGEPDTVEASPDESGEEE
jgi:hypothetical protein